MGLSPSGRSVGGREMTVGRSAREPPGGLRAFGLRSGQSGGERRRSVAQPGSLREALGSSASCPVSRGEGKAFGLRSSTFSNLSRPVDPRALQLSKTYLSGTVVALNVLRQCLVKKWARSALNLVCRANVFLHDASRAEPSNTTWFLQSPHKNHWT